MNDIARDAGLGGGLVAVSVGVALLTVWAVGSPGGDHGHAVATGARPVKTAPASPAPSSSAPTPAPSSPRPDPSGVPAGTVTVVAPGLPVAAEAAPDRPAPTESPRPTPPASSASPTSPSAVPAPRCGGDVLAVRALRSACLSIGGNAR